jgi:hypothetical protein
VGRILLSSVTDLAQISNLMKIRLVGSELLHGDGLTDEQIDRQTVVAFYNFANAPKNSTFRPYIKCIFLERI